MPGTKKICFVIMGFGTKTDFSTGKTLDLDQTYKNIIQPAVETSGFQCIRADEIQESGLIDKSMYALLMQADLVVADISTYNPNAIYELGIRHAVKPYTTIVLKEKDGKIPFDLDHTRIFKYSHLGVDIGAGEAKRCQQELYELITRTTTNPLADSPLYEYLAEVVPPTLPKEEYERIIGELADKEKHIFAIVEKARKYMSESNFEEAKKFWEKATEKVPSESFFIQQYALSIYKSKQPTELSALSDALRVIESLDPDGDTNDPETLGITGAIYKRMWVLNSDQEYLRRSIKYYEKGFKLRNDYYTGENYALCLNMMASIEENNDEKTYYEIAAKKARQRIIDDLISVVGDEEELNRADIKWIYATLSNCYYGLKDDENGAVYEKKFIESTDIEWEHDTFKQAKKQIQELIRS